MTLASSRQLNTWVTIVAQQVYWWRKVADSPIIFRQMEPSILPMIHKHTKKVNTSKLLTRLPKNSILAMTSETWATSTTRWLRTRKSRTKRKNYRTRLAHYYSLWYKYETVTRMTQLWGERNEADKEITTLKTSEVAARVEDTYATSESCNDFKTS